MLKRTKYEEGQSVYCSIAHFYHCIMLQFGASLMYFNVFYIFSLVKPCNKHGNNMCSLKRKGDISCFVIHCSDFNLKLEVLLGVDLGGVFIT